MRVRQYYTVDCCLPGTTVMGSYQGYQDRDDEGSGLEMEHVSHVLEYLGENNCTFRKPEY